MPVLFFATLGRMVTMAMYRAIAMMTGRRFSWSRNILIRNEKKIPPVACHFSNIKMETPEAQRIRTITEVPAAPVKRGRFRRRDEDDDDILVRFFETKVYSSGHVEYTSGRRFFKRRLDLDTHWSDLETMTREYLTYRLLYDLENEGMAIRCAKYDDEELTFHQLVLIKIT
jgi:hypothetical protein